LFYLFKGEKKIQSLFVAAYVLGVILITVANPNPFQIGSLVASILVLLKLLV